MQINCEAIHCFDTASVRFAIYPDGFDGPRILADITEDALRDIYGARGAGDSLVAACQSNFGAIEAMALERHRQSPFRAIVLRTSDFENWALSPESIY